MRGLKAVILFCILTLSISSCERIALQTTPTKKAVASNSALARQAEQTFWSTLHQGNYDGIPAAIYLLTAAYLENPNDPKLAAHLGFLHIWLIAESARLDKPDPTIINQMILAKRYFADAIQLDPTDPRFLGFYGVAQLAEGQIFADKRKQTRGYFTLKRAIRAWPQFNYFTAGYPMTTLPPSDKNFKRGLEWQWKTLDICAGQKIDRQNPDYSPYMHLETQQGPARVCWNSWIAPFNFEGFFLNMGDMLVKSGDWQTAIKIYQNAKLAKNYSVWPYRAVLEQRIAQAKNNVAVFNQPKETYSKTAPRIMFESSYSCMACHQQAD